MTILGISDLGNGEEWRLPPFVSSIFGSEEEDKNANRQNRKDVFFLVFLLSCLLITLAFVLHLALQLWVFEEFHILFP